jgi:hypothetical protein
MSNKQNFNDFFPTDNSSKTNLHYELVASKFMEGVESHQRRQYYNSQSNAMVIELIGGLFQIAIGLIVLVFGILKYLYTSISK